MPKQDKPSVTQRAYTIRLRGEICSAAQASSRSGSSRSTPKTSWLRHPGSSFSVMGWMTTWSC